MRADEPMTEEEIKCYKCHKVLEDYEELSELIIRGKHFWLCRKCFEKKLRTL